MRQAILSAPRALALVESPIPEPAEGEIVARVRVALTCGTDLKTYRRGHALLPFGPFGHEGSGEVVKVGAGVEQFTVGQRITWTPTAPCGECVPCQRGRGNLCDHLMEAVVLGSYADYLRINARVTAQHVIPLPDTLSFIEAAFIEPLACVLHGWRTLEPLPGRIVCIIGTGAMGYLHLLEAKRRDCWVMMVGRDPERLQLAKQMGADQGVLVAPGIFRSHGETGTILLEDLTQAVQQQTGGGADVVIEATGDQAVWELAPSCCAPGGKVLFYSGLPGGAQVTFDAKRLHYNEIALLGTFHYTTADVHDAYHRLTTRAFDVRPLITAVRPLDAIVQVFHDLEKGRGIKYALVTDETKDQ